jgi:hypothetical protein
MNNNYDAYETGRGPHPSSMLRELWTEQVHAVQRERKSGPSANLAFDTHFSMMSGCDFFDNWKSKAGSP